MRKYLKEKSDFIVLTVGKIAQALGVILTLRLMTQVLSVEEIGLQYTITAAVLWFNLVLINPFGMFVNRFLYQWKEDGHLASIIKKINNYLLCVACFALIVFGLNKFLSFFSINDFLKTGVFLVFVVCYLFFYNWFQTIASFFNILKQQKIYVFVVNLAQYLGLAFAYILTSSYEKSAIVWLSGILLGQVLAMVVAFYNFKKCFKTDLERKSNITERLLTSKTLHFCYPVAISTFFIWFLQQGYRLIVESNSGLSVLAVVGLGLGVANNCASVLESIVTQYLYPTYYSSLAGADTKSRVASWLNVWRESTNIYIPVIFFGIGNVYLLPKILISMPVSGVEKIIIFGFLIELFRMSSNILYLSLHGELQTKKSIFPYGIAAGFLFVLLLGSYKMSFFTPDLLIGLLCLSQLIIFVFMMMSTKKATAAVFQFRKIVKLALLSVPFLVSLGFFSHETPWLWLLGYALVSFLYLIFMLRKSVIIN